MTKRQGTTGRDSRRGDASKRDAQHRAPNPRDANRRLSIYLLLPTIFLTVALLGGVRVDFETRAVLFVAPPLVSFVLAALLMSSFARGHLVEFGAWLSGAHAPLSNVAHALTLVALFFGSAQAFNSVLPEAGLFRWLFAFFFLWTLWQNQFASFDARRTLRSLAALFATAFVLKHMLLASLYAPEGGWLKRVAGALVEGVTQGTFGERQNFAPATGYISFFTLALYVAGLALLPAVPDNDGDDAPRADDVLADYRQLPLEERTLARAEILREELRQLEAKERETTKERERALVDERTTVDGT
ncbi:MAG: hypothetical protein QOF61_2430 [Acidobacteriota bacterium]|jgi:hypothetical protein|nr:hypothetical protein [Acidobacteriota bacterium]